MNRKTIARGVVHDVADDFRDVLLADSRALAQWEDLTPLARNEWLCWVEDAKKADTRQRRLERTRHELGEGKRRPCCWPGCPHREKTGRP